MAETIKQGGRKRSTALTAEISPETVGFRLDEEHRRLLAQRARNAGVSSHDFARACLVEALHDRNQIPAMRDAIVALHEELTQFQGRFAKAIEALLVIGDDVDPESAKAFVEKHLKPD